MVAYGKCKCGLTPAAMASVSLRRLLKIVTYTHTIICITIETTPYFSECSDTLDPLPNMCLCSIGLFLEIPCVSITTFQWYLFSCNHSCLGRWMIPIDIYNFKPIINCLLKLLRTKVMPATCKQVVKCM